MGVYMLTEGISMQRKGHSKLKIRYAKSSDRKYLREWLSDSETAKWMGCSYGDRREIARCLYDWIPISPSRKKSRSILTAVLDGEPCGIALLWLYTAYPRSAHTCEFAIIVNPELRGRGIGRQLINRLTRLAKEKFQIEVFGLQIQAGNPAIHLFESCGFREYGRQLRWIKSYIPGKPDVGRILMEKYL